MDPMAPMGWRNHFGYSCVTGPLGFLLRTLFSVSRADITPLPEGPLILAPNHRSFLDPLVVGCLSERRCVFMMHAKYYDMPRLNWLYRLSRCIPVDGGDGNRTALRAGKQMLDDNRVLVIFPEGTISPDGEQQPPQPGMAWLARKSGAPVYPVHVGGTREVLTKGSNRLRIQPVTIRYGEPRLRDEFSPGRVGDDAFSKSIMENIARLGQATRL
jgi:1-acyl-sn-glycerol-3-phosphate acyltransferase